MDHTPPADPAVASTEDAQRRAWCLGEYSRIGPKLLLTAELLCETLDLRGGERVLDVATGDGNGALAAARRGCAAHGVDWAPPMLDRARRRAASEHLTARFSPADMEALPFEDASFDAVVSLFGANLAADAPAVCRELLRVCRPGGRIGLTTWAADGFVGRLFPVLSPDTPKAPAARDWATASGLGRLFGARAGIATTARTFHFRLPAPGDYPGLLLSGHGPAVAALSGLDTAARAARHEAILSLCHEFNEARDGTLKLRQDYLEAVITPGI